MAQVPSNPYDYIRTHSFTYNANGTVNTDTTEPQNPSACFVKTFGYDPVTGVVISTQLSACVGAVAPALFDTRVTGYSFAASNVTVVASGSSKTVSVAAGVGQTGEQNALLQSESMQDDPRFGMRVSSTDVSGLTTVSTPDEFGRIARVRNVDGTSYVKYYCYLNAGGTLDTSQASNSAGCPSVFASGEVPLAAATLTQVEMHSASDAKIGSFARTYNDRLGRQIRVVTESYDGALQPAGRNGVAVAQDWVYNAYGAKVLETKPFFIASGSSATAAGNVDDVGVRMSTVDVLGRTVAVAEPDPHGSTASLVFGGSGSVSYGNYGARTSALTQMARSGLTVRTTNDHAMTTVQEYAANGNMSRVTDANGAQLALLYDGFGNLTLSRDALQNTTKVISDYQGRRTEVDDTDRGVVTFTYDAIGNLIGQQSAAQRANATATTMTYDKLDRLVVRSEAEDVATWYFDRYKGGASCNAGAGRQCESTTASGVDRKNLFDNFGRLVSRRVDTGTGTPSFTFATGYDPTTGRISSVTYPTGLQVVSNYTALGYLQSMELAGSLTATLTSLPGTQSQVTSTLSPGQLLWRADAINAQGRIESETGATGISNRSTFEAPTGRITSLNSGAGSTSTVVNESYVWDSLGNLASRTDANGDGTSGTATSGAVSESFQYDGINRLKSYSVSAPGIPGFSRNVIMNYNALGSLLYKSDVGIFSYASAGSAHAHVPLSIASAALTSFVPDASGNIVTATAGKYMNMTYTGFDMIATASNAGSTVKYSWLYDENRRRIKEMHTTAANVRTLWYMNPDSAGGLEFEYETNSATSPLYSARHYISASGHAVAVLASGNAVPTLTSSQMTPAAITNIVLNKLETWHKDHLGSIVATTDQQGRLTERYAYDPFGKRRYAYGAYDASGAIKLDWNPAANFGTGRGFTGHEQLDDIGITNMNGRLFDPNMGIFIQADPEIADPHNLQSYNRYAYVLNNPLNSTDPTGFINQLAEDQEKDLAPDPNGSIIGINFIAYSGGNNGGQKSTSTEGGAQPGAQNNAPNGDPGTQSFTPGAHNLYAAEAVNKGETGAKPETPEKPDVPTTCPGGCSDPARQMEKAANAEREKGDQEYRDAVQAKIKASGEVKVFDKKVYGKDGEVVINEGKKDKKDSDPSGGHLTPGVDRKLLSLSTPKGLKVEASGKVELHVQVDIPQATAGLGKAAAGSFVQMIMAFFGDTVRQTGGPQVRQTMEDLEQKSLGNK